MKQIEDEELKLYKALSAFILDEIKPVILKLEKKAIKDIQKIKYLDLKLMAAEEISNIGKLSKQEEILQTHLINILALKNRLEIISKRNEERINFINKKFKESGIYNEKVDKQTLFKAISKGMPNFSDDSINLNPNIENRTKLKFFDGELLEFEGNSISFDSKNNENLLKKFDANFFHKIVQKYPYSVSTIPDKFLLDTNLKKKVLKEIASYVTEQSKEKPIRDINRDLGNLLVFKTQITSDAESYIAGVTNLFNVSAKQLLGKLYPDKIDDINKLNCNEFSELLPSSKKVAVLANGLSGDVVKTEQQESEDLRIKAEKEEKVANEINQLFEELFSEKQQENEDELEAKREEERKQAEENLKKEIEDEKTEEELSSMISMLKKSDD